MFLFIKTYCIINIFKDMHSKFPKKYIIYLYLRKKLVDVSIYIGI
jgi:hypothetical protein